MIDKNNVKSKQAEELFHANKDTRMELLDKWDNKFCYSTSNRQG